MKRILILLVGLLFMAGTVYAETRTTVTKDDSGTMSHVTYYKTDGGKKSGQTVWAIDQATGVSFYMDRLDVVDLRGGAGSGVSQLASGTSGYIPVYNSSTGAGPHKYLSGATIDPNTDIAAGVSTQRTVTGKTLYLDLSQSETLSGETLYGSAIGNYGATNEVTGTVPTAIKGMSVLFMLTQGHKNGSTIYVKLNSSDTIVGLTGTFSAGASTVCISGTTMGSYMQIEAWRNGFWYVTGVSGISYRSF